MLEHEKFVEKVKVSRKICFSRGFSVEKRFYSFRLKEQREKVRTFLELGDGMVSKDGQHIHSGDICQSMTAVRKSYTDFSSNVDKYKIKLETKLGKPEVLIFSFSVNFLIYERHRCLIFRFKPETWRWTVIAIRVWKQNIKKRRRRKKQI